MNKPELLTDLEIHAFGIEVVHNRLLEDGWDILSYDVEADRTLHPQIVATKDGETAFFVVRTGIYPQKGRIEGEDVFQNLVRNANSHGASCYFASVGIANSEAATEEEMSIPVKGVAYHVEFDGLIKMALPESNQTV